MNGAITVGLLRVIHILSAVFWVGTTLFLARFLLPSLIAAGPAGGAVMEQIGKVRRLPAYMMAATVLALLSGIELYRRDSAGFRGEWVRSGPGMVFGLGAVLALIAAVLGIAVNSPAGRRMSALAAEMRARGGAPSAEELVEIAYLQDRLAWASRIVAVLLVLSTAAMAVARYVP